jgi:glycerol-3-phosphate dehydrogenase (NAD(P)+)
MSIVTIVGAGMMGSGMCFPAVDNRHEVRLVGTPLDRGLIDGIRRNRFHVTLPRTIPDAVKCFQVEDLKTALEGADLVIGGVSSFGVDWFADEVLPLIPEKTPVISVTKGLMDLPDGTLLPIPRYLARKIAPKKLSLNAIGGPCTCYELADHNQTEVSFCGEDLSILRKIKSMLKTDYYHISCVTDVPGIECAVAMKNPYAAAVSLAVGINERVNGEGCMAKFNPEAALFGQSIREMGRLIALMGGDPDSITVAAGDLYVTIFGGRTRKLGRLLGQGVSYSEAKACLAGLTLESVSATTNVVRALRTLEAKGKAKLSDYPLLEHLNALINEGASIDVPWEAFTKEV